MHVYYWGLDCMSVRTLLSVCPSSLAVRQCRHLHAVPLFGQASLPNVLQLSLWECWKHSLLTRLVKVPLTDNRTLEAGMGRVLHELHISDKHSAYCLSAGRTTLLTHRPQCRIGLLIMNGREQKRRFRVLSMDVKSNTTPSSLNNGFCMHSHDYEIAAVIAN